MAKNIKILNPIILKIDPRSNSYSEFFFYGKNLFSPKLQFLFGKYQKSTNNAKDFKIYFFQLQKNTPITKIHNSKLDKEISRRAKKPTTICHNNILQIVVKICSAQETTANFQKMDKLINCLSAHMTDTSNTNATPCDSNCNNKQLQHQQQTVATIATSPPTAAAVAAVTKRDKPLK